jgi:outer membrane biosynthesis protein TonB
MKSWKVAALAGALLWGACSKEPAPAPAPAPKPVTQAATPAPEPEAEPEAEEPAPAAQPEPEPVVDTGEPPEFKIGQTRSEVMRLFGNCAERRAFVPAAPGALYVEIYQPKATEACVKRLGERHFTIRGGELYKIEPGIFPPEPPPGSFTPPDDV